MPELYTVESLFFAGVYFSRSALLEYQFSFHGWISTYKYENYTNFVAQIADDKNYKKMPICYSVYVSYQNTCTTIALCTGF